MNNNDHRFDIDLSKGQFYEKKLEKILLDTKVEVKSQIGEQEKSKWWKTHNACFELQYRDYISGVITTQADYWFDVYVKDAEIQFITAFPIDKLRKLIAAANKSGIARIAQGGDDNAALLSLIPFSQLFDYFLDR